MKKVVMALGAAVILSSVASVSEAKTNTTGSQDRNSLLPEVGVSLPVLYGVMGAVTLGAFGGMTYLFLKPINKAS